MKDADLNQRVTIQQQSTTQDEAGQPIQTWSDVAAAWASVKHTNGMQSIKSGADVAIVKASIRIRYRTGINAGLRVVHGSTLYDIKAVLPDGRQWLDLVCETVN